MTARVVVHEAHTQAGSADRELEAIVRPKTLRPMAYQPSSSFCAGWSGPKLKAFARKIYPFAGMSMRELVREWKRNGRTTVRMWLADDETSGARYPTPDFVTWLYHRAAANCARCGIVLPEAA